MKDCLILKYTHNKIGAVEQRIPFTWTTCNYGGNRTWFLCPSCGKRVAVLYSGWKYFACRGCTGIVYRSTGKTAIDRKLSRAKRLRLKIGGIPGPANDLPRSKPKFMHRKTWLQIKNEIYALELPFWIKSSRLNDIMQGKLNKIAKRMGREISWGNR